MSNTKSNQIPGADWQALQSQYWNAWSEMTRNAGAAAPAPTMPWQQGVEQWQRMLGGDNRQNETVERVLDSAKGYVALMQSMFGATTGQNFSMPGASAWTDVMRSGFNMPGMDASFLNNPMAKALQGISGQGVKGFEQLAAGAAPMFEQMRQQGMAWLQTPAFGYQREQQEHYQKMAVASSEFQQAVQRYNAVIMKSSQRAFAIFEDKLVARGEPGRQVDSMRALYDLWVDAAEEAYAEIALSEEFRSVYGEVVNAQMRLRALMQKEVERVGTDLGMPTRTELNGVHKKLHELRRQLRNLEDAHVVDDEAATSVATAAAPKRAPKSNGAAKANSKTKTEPNSNPHASTAAGSSAKQSVAPEPEKQEPVAFGDAINAMRDKIGAKPPARSRSKPKALKSDSTNGARSKP